MMLRDRRVALSLLLAAALVAVACGAGNNQQPPAAQPPTTDAPGGTGGVGEVSTEPTPEVTITASPMLPEDSTPAPTPKVSLTIKIIPTLILSEWPTPADCQSYNPNTVTLKTSGSGASKLWQVVDGSHILLAFKTSLGGSQGLALAKAYRQLCFIGRSTEATTDVVTYWMDPVAPPDVPNADCVPHDPSKLSVVADGSGWMVLHNNNEAIKKFSQKANANKYVLVLKHYNWHCYIGRDYMGADRLQYITEWAISAG
jgi:hypothetical protein